MRQTIINAICFIVAGVAFVWFFVSVFQAQSRAFDFGLDLAEQSNPSYYDGYGKTPKYIRYEMFKGLRECYGDAQATKLLESLVSRGISFSELDSILEACKVMKKTKKELKNDE